MCVCGGGGGEYCYSHTFLGEMATLYFKYANGINQMVLVKLVNSSGSRPVPAVDPCVCTLKLYSIILLKCPFVLFCSKAILFNCKKALIGQKDTFTFFTLYLKWSLERVKT